jgi:hypothetical protein
MKKTLFFMMILPDSCRADARRWIPAFAGMTMGLLNRFAHHPMVFEKRNLDTRFRGCDVCF